LVLSIDAKKFEPASSVMIVYGIFTAFLVAMIQLTIKALGGM
jgi:hypothetical protein